MRLLVSVRDAGEARAALAGGAEIIDAKEPARGALGAVTPGVLRTIRAVVGDARPLSAALGDALEPASVARTVHAAAELGLAYVKLGFRGEHDPERAAALLTTAVDAVNGTSTGTQVIAVAYADADRVGSLAPPAIIDIAARAGAGGVLLDTAVKASRGLLTLMPHPAIARWVRAAHEAALLAALAGRLDVSDFGVIRTFGADVVGVRGAACEGGREGRVSATRVRALVEAVRREHVRGSQESGCSADAGHAIPSAFSFP